jgi:glycosidase
MNYHGFAYPVKGFLIDGSLSATDFASQLTQRMTAHAPGVRFAMQNLMDSHDTDRVASMIVNAGKHRPYMNADRFDYDVGERVSPRNFRPYDVSRPKAHHRQIQRLVALFQIAYVGAPMIYYGTESGMDGADDPDDRMPMVWDDLTYQPRSHGPFGAIAPRQPIEFDQDLHSYYRSLFQLRSQSDALRRGDFTVLATDDAAQSIVFARSVKGETILIGFNRGDQTATIEIPTRGLKRSMAVTPVLSSDKPGEFTRDRKSGSVTLAPRSGQIWRVGKVKK